MKNRLITALLFFSNLFVASAQTAPFGIIVEPMSISGLGGLQAYAFGQNNGKWLLIGGRLDGLHRRQPFAAFDPSGNNNQLIVVDPVAQQKWSAPLTSLSVALQEQLSSTNMEFYQEGNYLYLTGGYGYSNTLGNFTTYASLVAVDVPATINAIVNGTPFVSSFRQQSDPKFQVTGGHLEKIYDTYYLVGGQKFVGAYNPMGPTSGPGFVQEYTNQIRKFLIADDGTSLSISHFPAITDSVNLHRRDYNVSAQIMPDGKEGITAFSGVFQQNVDLPFLDCVNIDSGGYVVNSSFSQYYNHYHCANLQAYSQTNNEMHTVFFGGISQYYDNAGTLVQDNNVPFVNTIARVTRDASGIMAEYKLPVEMPGFLGASSEFIPVETLSRYSNRVIKLDDLVNDTTLVGYIYGGINSTAANIFFINTGSESSASASIFKVYLVKNTVTGVQQLNPQSTGSLKLQVYPNPNNGNFEFNYYMKQAGRVKICLYDANGKLIEADELSAVGQGQQHYEKRNQRIRKGGLFLLTVETDYEKASQQLILEP